MIVNVKVKPGSSQEKIAMEDDEVLTIWTHARAHDGEANKKVIELVAKYYGVSKTSVKLVRGATSKIKTFEI
jgi:uncharacterized protein (TIGR00251 family)